MSSEVMKNLVKSKLSSDATIESGSAVFVKC